MAPTDDDQTTERENRVEEMMKGYRREHPPDAHADEKGPKGTESVPQNRRRDRRA